MTTVKLNWNVPRSEGSNPINLSLINLIRAKYLLRSIQGLILLAYTNACK